MNRQSRKKMGVVLAALVLALNYSPALQAAGRLPDELYLYAGQTHVLESGLPMRVSVGGEAIQVAASQDERLHEVSAVADGESSVTFSLLGLFPVHRTKVSVAQERVLIPGGQVIGVAMRTRGVLVVARGERANALRVGDVITAVESQPVGSSRELSALIAQADLDEVTLGVQRGNREITLRTPTPKDSTDGQRRLGVWVRDSTAGVGTLSFVDPVSGVYGALGHAIIDADTGDLLEVSDGAVMHASIVGVARGQAGRAGELRGSFLKENRQIGSLETNCEFGVYGVMDALPGNALYPQGLPVGLRSGVHEGEATIISTVDTAGPAEYSVEIVECYEQSGPAQKGMLLRVTDPRLLEKTGGIVQGMSGSPIIQDGKLIGAVTHVLVNDPTRGYGIFMETMLEAAS